MPSRCASAPWPTGSSAVAAVSTWNPRGPPGTELMSVSAIRTYVRKTTPRDQPRSSSSTRRCYQEGRLFDNSSAAHIIWGVEHDLVFGSFLTPSAERPERVVDLARLTEQVGLDLVTVQDHPYQARFLDTWTLLSVIAAVTSAVRVSPNVANLPLRPPAVLARSVATLDILSGGRVELGLGAGAFWDGIAALGGPRPRRRHLAGGLQEAHARHGGQARGRLAALPRLRRPRRAPGHERDHRRGRPRRGTLTRRRPAPVQHRRQLHRLRPRLPAGAG